MVKLSRMVIPMLIAISTAAIADKSDIRTATKICMINAIESYSDAGTGLKSSDIERIRIECEARARRGAHHPLARRVRLSPRLKCRQRVTEDQHGHVTSDAVL